MLCSFVSRETFFCLWQILNFCVMTKLLLCRNVQRRIICLWQILNNYVMTRRAVLSKRSNRNILPMAKFEQIRYNITRFMERCPSGLRSWSWKPVMRQRTVGSNPTLSARIIKASELFARKPFCMEKSFWLRVLLNVDSTMQTVHEPTQGDTLEIIQDWPW